MAGSSACVGYLAGRTMTEAARCGESARDSSGRSFRLQLFGRFGMHSGAVPLPCIRPRTAQWAVAILALRAGRPMERRVLAGMLWPDSPEETALGNLRRCLVEIRRAMAEHSCLLQSPTPRSLALAVSAEQCDVLAFDALLAGGDVGSLERAVAAYGGHLLEECDAEWALQERALRAEQCLAALQRLGELAIERGDLAGAQAHLRRAVVLDPLREAAHRLLMEVLAAGGDLTAAMLVYRELRARLHRELNGQPDPSTTALYHRLRDGVRAMRGAPGGGARGAAPPDPRRGLSPPAFPHPFDTFVGREQEVMEVRDLLTAARLVTLTGAGGIGKTRMALRMAEEVVEEFPDGVFFVELGPHSDPRTLPEVIGAGVGAAGRDPWEALRQALHNRAALLILDNCEHVLDGVAAISGRLLAACPHLRILATSRQALRLSGESVYRLPSLATPPLDTVSDCRPDGAEAVGPEADMLGALAYDAVLLFATRARSASASFRLTRENLPAVIRVCRLLDGIPLAIELAAARVTALSVEAIVYRLDRPLGLLTAGSRLAPRRHQTARALLDWSYELLEPMEQCLLRQLSVFAGGWTLEGAEAVCTLAGASERQEPAPAEVLDILSSLIDKSLVVFEPRGSGDRYRLLHVVREFAREKLEEAEGRQAIRDRHLRYYLTVAEACAQRLRGPDQGAALALLDVEFENLLAALQWRPDASEGAEQGLRLVGALRDYWQNRGFLELGLRLTRERLESPGTTSDLVRGRALQAAGELACNQGLLDEAEDHLRRSLAVHHRLGDPTGLCAALTGLGIVATARGDRDQARRQFEDGADLAHRSGRPELACAPLNGLGELARLNGDWEGAGVLYARCLALQREYGGSEAVSGGLLNLAMVALELGNLPAACDWLEQAIPLIEEDGLEARAQAALDVAAAFASCRGEEALAVRLLTASEAGLERMGMRRAPPDAEFVRRWCPARSCPLEGGVRRPRADRRELVAVLGEFRSWLAQARPAAAPA